MSLVTMKTHKPFATYGSFTCHTMVDPKPDHTGWNVTAVVKYRGFVVAKFDARCTLEEVKRYARIANEEQGID